MLPVAEVTFNCCLRSVRVNGAIREIAHNFMLFGHFTTSLACIFFDIGLQRVTGRKLRFSYFTYRYILHPVQGNPVRILERGSVARKPKEQGATRWRNNLYY